MSKAPSMPMYWDAYLADTTHLTTEEHGAYMLLLAAMWRRNGAVPDDDKDNARILGLTTAKWRKTKARLVSTIPGFRIEGNLITQEKLQKTWKNTQEKIDKNRANGAKGGRAASSKNNGLAQANATVSQSQNPSIPEPEPEPERKKELTDLKKGKSARDWIWSEGVDHLVGTTNKSTGQARSSIGGMLKMCDEKPDRLFKYFIHALEQGESDLISAVKAQIGERIAKAASGTDRPDLVAVGFTDGRYKPLQDRHEAELGKRKFMANGVSHFPKSWVDEMAGIGGN